MLIFPQILAKAIGPATATYIASASDVVDRATYTFAASAFGSPTLPAGALVLVTHSRYGANPHTGISTITESSNSLTKIDAQINGQDYVDMWELTGRSAGALGSIVITPTGALVNRMAVDLYVVENWASTGTAVKSTASAPSMSVTVPALGCVIAGAFSNTGGPNATWTGTTEKSDGDVDGSNYTSSAADSEAGGTVVAVATFGGGSSAPAGIAVPFGNS